MARTNEAQIIYTPRPDATPQAELSALVAVYRYVLFNSQARKGDPHDLTNGSTIEVTKIGLRKTERQKT
jgi:hypothetical protein